MCTVTCATCCAAVVLVYCMLTTTTTQDVGGAGNVQLLEAVEVAGAFAKAQSAAADAGKSVTDMLAVGGGLSGSSRVGAGINVRLVSVWGLGACW